MTDMALRLPRPAHALLADGRTVEMRTAGPDDHDRVQDLYTRRVARLMPVLTGDAGRSAAGRRAAASHTAAAATPEIRAEIIDEVVVRALLPAPRAIGVSVRHGVVTLEGCLERRSEISVAEGLARRVDGVVAVVNRLTYRLDDTHRRPVEPAADRLHTS